MSADRNIPDSSLMGRREFSAGAFAGALSLVSAQGKPALAVNGDRLNASLEGLRRFGGTAAGGTNRVAYSDFDKAARAYSMDLMKAAGLSVSIDPAGNIVGRLPGSSPGMKPIGTGSHIDSVPDGGSFDGQVGAMAAIEVARTIVEKGIKLRHPLEVIVFQNEEGGTVGSRALVHELTPKELDLVTNSRKKVREGIDFIGGDVRSLASGLRRKGDLAAFVELHIEQGGTLDREKIQIGVVEGIVGVNWWEITITGMANHAGTTPMDQRQDALLAAAQFILAVNRIVRSVPGRQVGTVGKLSVSPGATNVIPGKVETSLDLRDLDSAKVKSIFSRIQEETARIEKSTGTRFEFRPTNWSEPALSDTRIKNAVREAAVALGLSHKELPSGAGHDSQEMALICPMGMIFVPSRGGISHSPREYSSPFDITNGANVLLRTLVKIDESFS